MRLLERERSQTSLEYLYLTAFVIGLAAVIAMLIQNMVTIKDTARDKIEVYRDDIIKKLTQ